MQLGLAVSLGDVAIERDQLHLLTQIHGRAVLLGIPLEVGQPNRREGADSPNRGTKELSLTGEGGEGLDDLLIGVENDQPRSLGSLQSINTHLCCPFRMCG